MLRGSIMHAIVDSLSLIVDTIAQNTLSKLAIHLQHSLQGLLTTFHWPLSMRPLRTAAQRRMRIRSRTIQPVVSRYTNWATWPTHRTHRYSNFKMRLWVGVNKSQVGLYVCLKSFTRNTKFYQFLHNYVFGCNFKASSNLLWKLIQEKFYTA